MRKITIVKVGSHDRPATEEDIQDIKESLDKAWEDSDHAVLVTHHAVTIEHCQTDDGKVTVVSTRKAAEPGWAN